MCERKATICCWCKHTWTMRMRYAMSSCSIIGHGVICKGIYLHFFSISFSGFLCCAICTDWKWFNLRIWFYLRIYRLEFRFVVNAILIFFPYFCAPCSVFRSHTCTAPSVFTATASQKYISPTIENYYVRRVQIVIDFYSNGLNSRIRYAVCVLRAHLTVWALLYAVCVRVCEWVSV